MSLNDFFKTSEQDNAQSKLDHILVGLVSITSDTSFGDASLTRSVIAKEDSNGEHGVVFRQAESLISSLINDQVNTDECRLTETQVRAGTLAGILGASPKEALSYQLRNNSNDALVLNGSVAPSDLTREVALESYNMSDFRSMQRASVAYNILASNQDDLGNLFFPPLLMDPRVTGIETEISISNVFNDFKRSTSGTLAEFNRRNILRGFVNPEITRNNLARIYPVVREIGPGANVHNFVDSTLVDSHQVVLGGGVKVTTAPLKIGETFDLLGISQRDEMLADGNGDFTDSLSPVLYLKNIYLKFGTVAVKIATLDMRESTFLGALTGNQRKVVLNFDNDSIVLNEKTRDTKGNLLSATIPELVDTNVRLRITMNGSVFTDSADSKLTADKIGFVNATDAAGELVDENTAKAIKDAVVAGEVVAYDLDGHFDNWNLRNLGLLVESQTFKTIINVPYLSPISSIATTYEQFQGDADKFKLNELVSVCNISSSHAAIEKILQAAAFMENYRAVPDKDGNLPGMMGIGSYYVLPYFLREKIRIADFVDGTNSSNRSEDIQAGLLERFHTYIMNMLIRSEYLAVARKITGNNNFVPTAIVGTDPFIASYINSRSGTVPQRKEYNLKFGTSLSRLAEGKVFISFSNVSENTSQTKLCPLSFGAFAYSTELVSKLQKSWNGQVSNALTVTPRWLHIWNLPVMTVIDVEDMNSLSMKLPIHTKAI